MNTYKNKYLKYKSKYLNLVKKINQIGGGSVKLLKGINLFENGSLEQQYLDPTFGYIYSKNYLENLVKIGSKHKITLEVFDKTFIKHPHNPIYLTHKLVIEDSKKLAEFIGEYLGYHFLEYIKKKEKVNISREAPKYKKIKTTFLSVFRENRKRNGKVDENDPIDNNLLNTEVFRLILTVLWMKTVNKLDIKSYYLGLKKAGIDVNIPDNFEIDVFSNDDLSINNLDENSTLNKLLAAAKIYYENEISLENQKLTILRSRLCKVDYPDCGSISLRNFIKILAYDETDRFNIDVLTKLGAVKKLIDFFSIFNTDLSLMKDKRIKILYNENNYVVGLEENQDSPKISSRDAWGLIVSNLPKVSYLKRCAEISSGIVLDNNKRITNMMMVIKNLFTKINTWDDFNDVNNLKILQVNLSSNGIGNIIFSKQSNKYNWIFNKSHFNVENVTDQDENNEVRVFKENEIIKQLYLSGEFDKDFKNLPLIKKFTFDDISRIYNHNIKFFLKNKRKEYKIFLNYVKNWISLVVDPNILFKRRKEVKRLFFGDKFNQKLDDSLDKYTRIKELKFDTKFNQPLENSLIKLTRLKKLVLSDDFDQPLGNSLDKLVKLKELTFRTNFNQPLGNSLDKLTNLTKLSFGSNFNQPLGNSLDNLINLTELSFHRNFNQHLGNSLSKLTNLIQLRFYDKFNQPLGNSLSNLVKLNKLVINYHFNQPLGNSLDSLVNLRTLLFHKEFNQPLGTSLNKLVKLETLKFGYEFNQTLNDSFNKLINLRTLHFGHNFNQPLNNSLDKLTNLESLKLGANFSQLIGTSFDKLVNLQLLGYQIYHHKNSNLDTDGISQYRRSKNFNLKLVPDYDHYGFEQVF